MYVKCEVCGCEFTVLVKGQVYGTEEGNDYNINEFICPNPDCISPVIIKSYEELF